MERYQWIPTKFNRLTEDMQDRVNSLEDVARDTFIKYINENSLSEERVQGALEALSGFWLLKALDRYMEDETIFTQPHDLYRRTQSEWDGF